MRAVEGNLATPYTFLYSGIFSSPSSHLKKEKGTGYLSSGFLGLPRFRIVDSNPSATAIFACQSSVP